MVLTYILYPYPDRKYERGEKAAIAIEFLNAFDIMDLVENIGCIQSYTVGWVRLFYIALAVSTILLAFPVGLTEDDEHDPQGYRIISSAMTLIFTDVLFCIIRGHVMIKEESVQSGFNFFLKNLLAAICRFILICKSRRSNQWKHVEYYLIYFINS